MILGWRLTAVLVVGASLLGAQQVPGSFPASGSGKASSRGGASVDYAKLAAKIDASYYHPDGLSGLDCGTVVDFGSLFKQLGQSPSEELTNELSGFSIKAHALRDQAAKIDIAWLNGVPANKENFESGTRQTLGGFFQMYWGFFGSSISGGGQQQDDMQIETLAGGGHLLHGSDHGAKMTVEVDSDNVPAKLSMDSGAMKVTAEFHFAPTQVPAPGDLRRLTFLDYSNQIGTNMINGRISIDYQNVEGFNVPRHLSVGSGGAFALPIELVNCSVAKPAASGAEPK
jgi:hypothetical protein